MRLTKSSANHVALAMMTLVLGSNLACGPSPPPSSVALVPDRITLYEGLPHQGYEPEKFAEEKKKPTLEMGGFPFYRDPLALKEPDAKALGEILFDRATFQPFGGETKCGGFHPDYAVVASTNGEETSYLICFGCGEVKVCRPDRSETRYDLARDVARPRLVEILKPYRKNRPDPTRGP